MKPNILLFFPDQHRGDWTGYCGASVRTPHLDDLARRGQAFTNALTPSPLCSPARACLTSAKPYDAQPVRHNQHDVNPEEANIYHALRDAGYAVLGCGKFDLLMGAMDWGEDGRHGDRLHDLGFTGGIDNAGKHDFVTAHRRGRADSFQAFLAEHDLLETHLVDYASRTGVDNSMYTTSSPPPRAGAWPAPSMPTRKRPACSSTWRKTPSNSTTSPDRTRPPCNGCAMPC